MIFGRIYSIIKKVALKNPKGEWIFILSRKLKFYTKEIFKFLNITIIAFGLIIAIILVKYKPIYKVSISGEEVGYIQNKETFEESVKESIITNTDKNIDNVDLEVTPEYELKLVDKTLKTNEQEVAVAMQKNMKITYKYYEVTLENNKVDLVDTKQEAEEIVNKVKAEKGENVDLAIVEKYTNNESEINTNEIEVAKAVVSEAVEKNIQEKAEQERINALPDVNGIKLAFKPVSGTITSRYGVSSRIRVSTHTGLDIGAPTGTPIQVVAGGTVTCASWQGAYGYMVKVDHGNNVETWYAHTSKMYVKVGQKVSAGDVIAAVGSTGNSTGAHLHLEIRVNGVHVNPQNYLYK